MKVVRVYREDALRERLTHFAEGCSWIAGKHLAGMLREWRFSEWEAVFAAMEGDEIVGMEHIRKEERLYEALSGIYTQTGEREKAQAMVKQLLHI